MKNFKKISIPTILIIFTLLLIACTLQTTFAANSTIDDNTEGGIRGAVTNTTVNPGDTIYLQPGTYNKTGNDTNFAISKNITLQGNGPASDIIIDAQGAARITINTGLNVTFINITFVNFTNNGAIYAGNTNMAFINCIFENNSGTSGGVIYSFGNLTINNSTFTNTKNISAIYSAADTFGTTVNITDSNFKDNLNGAVSVYSLIGNSDYNTYITNCSFINNNRANGGAIIGTTASANPNNFNLIVVDCIFMNNNASSLGGGIHVGTGTNGYYNLTVINSSFTNNSATQGGGIYSQTNNNGTSNITISNSNFRGNKATSGPGGAFALTSSTGTGNIIVDSSNFTGNIASGSGALYVGGGASSKANLTVNNSNIINNTANNGGGIGADCTANSQVNIVISNSNIINNTANNRGGGISVNSGINSTTTININDNTIVGNTADNGGGIFATSGINSTTTTNINDNTIVGNTADNGGGIYNNGSITVTGNIMNGNVATVSGNMIYNNGTMGILRLTYLSNSTVKTSNGSVMAIYATLTDDMGNTVTGQDISFYVDGVFIANVTSIEGKANITYSVTKGYASVLPVTGEYAGHGEYSIVTLNGALLVPKIVTNKTIDVAKKLKVGQNTTLKSRLTDKDGNPIANATIDFYINGKRVGSGITDFNGIARLDYPFTKAGSYNVQAKYAGNGTYEASSAIDKTIVLKTKTITKIDKDGDKVTVTLTDEDGNPLEGKKITLRDSKGRVLGIGITNKDGQVVFIYSGNSVSFKASFDGDDIFEGVDAKFELNQDNNQTSNDPVVTTATMKDTGMPIIPILLILLTTLGVCIRKQK